MNVSKLNIHAINVNSIVSHVKRQELSAYIAKYSPDILLLSETRLRPKHVVGFNGYNCFRDDRSANTLGTCVLFRESLVVSRFIPPTNLANKDLSAIKVRCGDVDLIMEPMVN